MLPSGPKSMAGPCPDQLPFEQRAAVQLTYWLGLSCRGDGCGDACPTNTVKTRMLYARRSSGMLPALDGSVTKPGGGRRTLLPTHRPQGNAGTLCQAVDRSALPIRARSFRALRWLGARAVQRIVRLFRCSLARHGLASTPSIHGDFYVSFTTRAHARMEIV